MPNVMVVLPHIGGVLCSIPQSLADAHYLTPATWLPCSNAAKTWKPLKFAGVPQTRQQISAAIVGRSSSYCWDIWRRYCCLPFYSDCRYVPWLRRYSPTKLYDSAQMAIFSVLHFQRAACSTFQTCILNSHYGHTMRGSMADIQSPTTKIRRWKKERRKETTGQKYNGLPYSI